MKTRLPRESQTKGEKTSCLTLFCALMTAKNSTTTLGELNGMVVQGTQ